MKNTLLFLLVVNALPPCRAQWAVVDVANIQQSAMNYAALVEQISNQASQITNQVRQIQQFEAQLKRMGDMGNLKAIVGFPEFRADLSLPTKITTWVQGLSRVDGRRLFGDTRGGIFTAIGHDFPDFDGGVIQRESDSYRPAQQITASVDEFKTVQTDVYGRREQLRNAIAQTSDALAAADNEADEKKLSATLNAQYHQLAALDSDVGLSAAGIQVQAAESAAITNAQNEADAEAQRKLAQQEAEKIRRTFRPIYGSILLYVNERPYQP